MEFENKNLTREEAEKVTGGEGDNGIFTDWCPFCGEGTNFYMLKHYTYTGPYREFWHCARCGDLTYFKSDNCWVHGIVLD